MVCGASRCWRGGAAKARSAILPVLPRRLMIHHSLLLGTSVNRSSRSRDRRMASMLERPKYWQRVPQPMYAQKPVATQHALVVTGRLLECSDHLGFLPSRTWGWKCRLCGFGRHHRVAVLRSNGSRYETSFFACSGCWVNAWHAITAEAERAVIVTPLRRRP